ncbi:hypothetical protein SISSUDRAFT_1066635 [Sistotremastrum suecicum HHB10207 ss-3]|uniref:Uncharacterized protein n=1 Tax=Sistotremastrum suecicum HHB10207 ss-3 TaxID=1314776 RepID=A0A165Y327_9AGAM|nr:hypothetical protein SISSUDRAFT_1066635 [Sistotremastrum suecicum HHB10207 ss-3]
MSQSSAPRTPPRTKKRRRDVEWSPNQIEKLSKSSKLSTPPRKTPKKRTLLQYLTKPRPRIRINPDRAEQPPGSLTSSTQYRAGDIKGMHRWTDFHLEEIQRKYGEVLKTWCPARQVYPSHRKGDTVQGETEISLRLAKGLITAVNRGLDHAHHEVDPGSPECGAPPQAAVQKLLDEKHLYMYIVSGTVIKIDNNFSDDLVAKTPKNTGCVSIEVKPSYNFRARWRSKQEKQSRVDFMQEINIRTIVRSYRTNEILDFFYGSVLSLAKDFGVDVCSLQLVSQSVLVVDASLVTSNEHTSTVYYFAYPPNPNGSVPDPPGFWSFSPYPYCPDQHLQADAAEVRFHVEPFVHYQRANNRILPLLQDLDSHGFLPIPDITYTSESPFASVREVTIQQAPESPIAPRGKKRQRKSFFSIFSKKRKVSNL